MATRGTGKDPVPGRVIRVTEIPARHGTSLEVRRGQVLRVVDIEGQQVGDFGRGNLAEAMAPWGVALRDIPFSFNIFMRWPEQDDGSVRPMAAPSQPGDYVDLGAEMDLVVANSACPSDITPTNAPTPMRFVLYEPDESRRA